MNGQHIIAIDQSTSSSKVFLLDAGCRIVRRFSKEHHQSYPRDGHVEHDANEIWQNVLEGIQLMARDANIAALAISNQRETTVFWDRKTGEPLCPAIVWQDVRGECICEALSKHATWVRSKTGLTLSAYFPAAKIAAKMQEDTTLAERIRGGDVCVGTVDSYLIYRLTGGQVFATDVSNASRTQLMDIHTLSWSEELCQLFGIPLHCLPTIQTSDSLFGLWQREGMPGIPITGVMGDSHAAFYGQGCHAPGMTKATFGTGSSVMMHIGDTPVLSTCGLSTSVGYSYGGHTCYVLEGNVTSSGDTLRWLQEEAGMVGETAEVERISSMTDDTGGVYLVPAFSGIGAPYNHPEARALICGLNRASNRQHIIRAALESMAYQDADIIHAMVEDVKAPLTELRTDGGPTANSILMQFLADVVGCDVQCASARELSALGAGLMAGQALGLYPAEQSLGKGERYLPMRDEIWRKKKRAGWQAAVARSAQS